MELAPEEELRCPIQLKSLRDIRDLTTGVFESQDEKQLP